jgi:hypothetical protein
MKKTSEILAKVLQESNIKFTPAQKQLVDNFLGGKILINVNEHRMSGGELMWIDEDNNLRSVRHAGRVYKALIGVNYALEKYMDVGILQSELRGVRVGSDGRVIGYVG